MSLVKRKTLHCYLSFISIILWRFLIEMKLIDHFKVDQKQKSTDKIINNCDFFFFSSKVMNV